MKQHLVTAIICQGLLSSVTAVPLTQLIIQENDKLKVKIEAYKKQCGGKQANDEKCTKRRYELSGDLGKFVALANEELALLNPANLSPDIPASDRQQFMARRRQIEQMVRVTLDAMKSLGSPDSNSKSSTESAALVATTADDSARIEAQTKLKDEIEKALGKSYRSVPRVWDVQITGQAIKVRFSIQDNLTEGLIKGSARSDSRKILQTAQSA